MPSRQCSVCGATLESPLYQSIRNYSLTSLCRLQSGHTIVYCCQKCTHLQTPPIDAIDSYYADDYDILVASEEEDQIYEMRGSKPVFRTAHQVDLLIQKLALPDNLKILDYGCAKSSTMRALKELKPKLDVHLFDVSTRYVPYWETFLDSSQWAVNTTPRQWHGRFDLITSFFSLEHIPNLDKTLQHITSLLRPGGTLYAVVPNVLTNIADFIVIDHCNHFTPISLRHLAAKHNLAVQRIDFESHVGALVFVAQKSSTSSASAFDANEISETLSTLLQSAEYWRKAGERIANFEENLPEDEHVAIYGAGFYGAFIASNLRRPEQAICHLDQNPFLHGKNFNGRRVLPPSELPIDIATILVGLNPRHASSSIAAIPALQRPGLQFFYL